MEKNELERILGLSNENFISTCFAKLQKLKLTDLDMAALTDVTVANDVIKERNRYTYPIIKEVSLDGEVSKDEWMIKGNRRYYSDKYYLNGRAYILCNDWYYPSSEKKNSKDTRTPFLKWIERLEFIRY